MKMVKQQKTELKHLIVQALSPEKEVRKIVIFGSFISSENPADIDIAVFHDSNDKYLSLSLKYRKLMRNIAKILPVDVLPLKSNARGVFLSEINSGELIYEG